MLRVDFYKTNKAVPGLAIRGRYTGIQPEPGWRVREGWLRAALVVAEGSAPDRSLISQAFFMVVFGRLAA